MKTIYKYELYINDIVIMQMPKSAEVIACKMQNNKICLWAIVDSDSPDEERLFRIAGTGHPLELDHIPRKDMVYIDSVIDFFGKLVFHIFEIKQ